MPLSIRRAALEEIIDLRHVMLRQGMPRSAAIFEGDARPDSRHYTALMEDRVVGCATFHLNQWENQPAWQLRGMAVLGDLGRRGIGRALLAFAEWDILAGESVHLMWCNARVPAIGFYEKQGWEVRSNAFDVPTAGPHVKMVRVFAMPGK